MTRFIQLSNRIINIDRINIVHFPQGGELVLQFHGGSLLTLKEPDASRLWEVCQALALVTLEQGQ